MKSLVPESFRLLVAGVNHRTATLALREALAFNPQQTIAALAQLREKFPHSQAVILSTCNRVEIYLAAPAAQSPTLDDLAAFLADFHRLPPQDLAGHLYLHEDHAMVRHLFAVASSLDSMVVGETQILGQVKAAYQQACTAQTVGKIFHALFQRALAAAREVHEKTRLSAGRLSIASVAIDLARSVFDRFDDKTVVCVGAGKMASLMLKHLTDLHSGQLLITNRSHPRALAAAAEFSGTAHPFEELDALLTQADILLTSTGAEHPIITEERFRPLLKLRRYRPLVIVDIAVPRDVEPAVAGLTNIYLYNIDNLQEIAAGNRDQRHQEIAASHTLLETHLQGFLQWYDARDVGPLVKALYERCHEIAKAELDAAQLRRPAMTAEERAELERFSHRLIGKILHAPVSRLTLSSPTSQDSESQLAAQLSAALEKLFNLDSPSKE